jgi:redoxin
VPHIKELQQKHADKGLVVIGVHTPFGAENLDGYLKEKQIDYTVALDAATDASGRKGKTVSAYQVDSFPDYYLVDRKGVLRYADVANASVDAAVEELLAEKP